MARIVSGGLVTRLSMRRAEMGEEDKPGIIAAVSNPVFSQWRSRPDMISQLSGRM